MHNLKKLAFWAKSKIKNQKSVFSPVFPCKPNRFRRRGGSCWPIGVIAGLLGRLLSSYGHELVKKPRNLGPKVLQIVHFLTGRVILKSYGEIGFYGGQ
jgi:hypothetical protein